MYPNCCRTIVDCSHGNTCFSLSFFDAGVHLRTTLVRNDTKVCETAGCSHFSCHRTCCGDWISLG
jgi:hypothetical protein